MITAEDRAPLIIIPDQPCLERLSDLVPPDYSIVSFTCCSGCRPDAVMVGWVLLKIVCLLTCRLPGVATLVFRGDPGKAAELLVLRHENAMLRRHVSRVRYEPADQACSPRWPAHPPAAGGSRSSS
jgi:hypothetical protein